MSAADAQLAPLRSNEEALGEFSSDTADLEWWTNFGIQTRFLQGHIAGFVETDEVTVEKG